MNKDLEIILNYLREKRGFDYRGYKASMIQRRLMQRVSATSCGDRDILSSIPARAFLEFRYKD